MDEAQRTELSHRPAQLRRVGPVLRELAGLRTDLDVLEMLRAFNGQASGFRDLLDELLAQPLFSDRRR